MFYKNKVEKLLELQRRKNEATQSDGQYHEEDNEKLGFKMHLAIILSALLVFGPIFLVLFGLLHLVARGL